MRFSRLLQCGSLALACFFTIQMLGCSASAPKAPPAKIARIFDSSKIPGEILDLCVVKTSVVKEHPEYAQALTGIWYETLGIMNRTDATAESALTAMAELSQCSLQEYQSQLGTTAMYWTPATAADHTRSADLKDKMDLVRRFCFDHGLLGKDVAGPDVVGIEYPDGSIQGDKNNVKLRFTTEFMDKAAGGSLNATAGSKKKFIHAVSIYAGWMPWYYAWEKGIVKKWADKMGIEIEVVYMDYGPSLTAFGDAADSAVMTNMEALDVPAAGGIDTTAIIMGDYSNGNDAILTRGISDIKGLAGQEVMLVDNTVSHYMLVRALEMNGLKESDVKILPTSDKTIQTAFLSDPSKKVVVTWNPMVMGLERSN